MGLEEVIDADGNVTYVDDGRGDEKPTGTTSTVTPNDPNAVFNRTVALRKAYWKYLYRLPTQAEFNQAAFGKQGQLIPKADFEATLNSIPGSEAAIRAKTENKDKWNDTTVPGGTDFGESTGYDSRAQGGGSGDGTGYNLERLKAAWLGAAGKYAPTRAGLAQFIDDNKGPGGFAEGVTIGGSKKNKLYLGNESGGTFLGDVIRGTDSDNPTYDWDTSTGGGSTQTAASTSETAAQRAARLAALGFGSDSFQPRAAGPMPDQPTLGDMMGPQGPIQDPGTYTPGAAYQAPEYRAPDPYQVATPFDRPEYQAATPFAAPTAADMGQDPGYQFRLSEGQRALERSGAARGVTNTGGNMKGLLDYGQQAASQEYGNVYNRNLNTYNTNEANRAGAYQTNYGNALNAYNMNEANRASGYNTNAANAFQQYSTNALAGNAFNQDTEARRSGAFGVNTNLYQKQQQDAYERTQTAYDQAMSRYQAEFNNNRQRERDRMSDLQFAAGA